MEMVFFSTLFSTISVFILRIFVDVKMSAVPMMWIVGVFSGGLFFIGHGESPVGLTLGMMLTLLVLIFYMIGPLYREVRLKISNQGLNAIFSLVVALLIVVILYFRRDVFNSEIISSDYGWMIYGFAITFYAILLIYNAILALRNHELGE